MSVTPRLELRQSQSLVMTPRLQQSLKMLRMSNLELAEHVAGIVEANPLLEAARPPERPIPAPRRAARGPKGR
jgi:RNA polymerase sigma-54 factor